MHYFMTVPLRPSLHNEILDRSIRLNAITMSRTEAEPICAQADESENQQ